MLRQTTTLGADHVVTSITLCKETLALTNSSELYDFCLQIWLLYFEVNAQRILRSRGLTNVSAHSLKFASACESAD